MKFPIGSEYSVSNDFGFCLPLEVKDVIQKCECILKFTTIMSNTTYKNICSIMKKQDIIKKSIREQLLPLLIWDNYAIIIQIFG